MSKAPSTKTEIRNTTAKANKLLRGIDNDSISLQKDLAKVEAKSKSIVQNVKVAQTLLTGLSNAALAQPVPAKVTKVTAKPAKAEKVKAEVKEKAPKAEKVAKPAKAEKVAKPAGDRPALKVAIKEVILKAGQSLPAATIYKTAVEKYGYWSRQSLYNALKTADFVKNPDGTYDNSIPTTSEDEADDFVKTVEGNQAVSAVS